MAKKSFFIIAAFSLLLAACGAQSDPKDIALAQCLKARGVKMYGVYWCSACAKQKQMFGKEAFASVNYIECDPRGEDPNLKLCAEKKIESTPTWEFPDGTMVKGVMELPDIAAKAECAYGEPKNDEAAPAPATEKAATPEPAKAKKTTNTKPLDAPVNIPAEEINKPAVQVISVTAGNVFFKPNTITVKAGVPVRIKIANTGEHTFTIDGLGVNTFLTKASAVVSFTPKTQGRFKIRCAVPGHAEAGMVGTLVVE